MPPPIPSPTTITPSQFTAALSRYPALLQKISGEKQAKNGKRSKTSLAELDTVRFESLPGKYGVDLSSVGKSGAIKPLEKADLVKLVTWKLSHGTFRPALLAHASSNPESVIKEASTAAVQAITSNLSSSHTPIPAPEPKALTQSLKHLTTPLKGIGPATASLILSLYLPSLVPFFSDELFYWLCLFPSSGGKTVSKGWKANIKYNVKEYEALVEAWGRFTGREGFGDTEAGEVERVAWVLVKEGEGLGLVDGGSGEAEEEVKEEASKKRRLRDDREAEAKADVEAETGTGGNKKQQTTKKRRK